MNARPAASAPPRPRTISAFVETLYSLAGSSHEPVDFGRMILIGDTAQADTILKNPDLFQKQYALVTLLGKSRLDAEGALWEKRRDLTQPIYSRAGRSDNRENIRALFERTLDDMPVETGSDLRDAMLVAGAAVFHQIFAIPGRGDDAARFVEAVRPILRAMQHTLLFGGSEADVATLRQQAKDFREAVAAWDGGGAPLAAFLAALAGPAGDIPEFDALGEYIMNLLANTDAITAAISWMLDRLGTVPDLQERLHAEMAAGGHALTDGFINETLRYFPPIPFLIRRAAEDVQLGGMRFAKGRVLAVSLVALHHDPAHWEHPRRFEPERREFRDNAFNRRAFLPFSMGRRVCGGAGLARVELTEALRAVLRRWRLSRAAGPVRFDFGLALRPESLDLVTLRAR